MTAKSRVPFDLSQLPAYLERELESLVKEVNGYVTKRYVPIWTGAGGNPTIGNGYLGAKYRLNNDLCELWLRLVIGSTTTLGTGAWAFSLPVAAKEFAQYGELVIRDASGNWIFGASQAGAGASGLQCLTHGSATLVGAAAPIAWASDDELHAHIRYLR